MSKANDTDTRWMRTAIALAKRHEGLTAPNPCVGCVIVHNGQLVGSGVTARSGRPHAETEALHVAGDAARGATAYVTLEPCAHTGQTGPCADALIKAGVVRVVIACPDPDARVDGRGIQRLREAGIEVETGICAAEAEEILRGFFLRVKEQRPSISLKLASTVDGRIATQSGESHWITSEQARSFGHLLRAQHEAILTGSGTYLADSPTLTCRLPGMEDRSPQPILLDRRKRCSPPESWWHLTEDISLEEHLSAIAERGISSLLVEAGATLSAALLKTGMVDRLYWFQAPATLGASGLEALGDFGVETLAQMPRFALRDQIQLGPDTLSIMEKMHD